MERIIEIIYLLFILIFFISFTSIALAGILLTVPVPTPQKAVNQMLKIAKIKKGDKVYDLGCGDGRIIITAAKNFDAYAIGYEISILHFLITKFKIKKEGLSSKVKVIYGNFYQKNFSDASLITIFGIPNKMNKVGETIQKSALPGTKIVSYAFPIPQFSPLKVVKLKNLAPIYLYQMT